MDLKKPLSDKISKAFKARPWEFKDLHKTEHIVDPWSCASLIKNSKRKPYEMGAIIFSIIQVEEKWEEKHTCLRGHSLDTWS